ncbi:hypothetical protein Uis4E_0142 [Bifidobacterium parmae]|uniref:Uncharacterized protein n=1 Tax=Bifidobacterium parmae TaxID=361854 RepID=A0A2N5J6G0_9BIFI|nr:hypothetical protein Uis4E_0142 [Bifidobacterium parmae]
MHSGIRDTNGKMRSDIWNTDTDDKRRNTDTDDKRRNTDTDDKRRNTDDGGD